MLVARGSPAAVGVCGKGLGVFQRSGAAVENPSGSAWDRRLLRMPPSAELCLGSRWGTPPGTGCALGCLWLSSFSRASQHLWELKGALGQRRMGAPEMWARDLFSLGWTGPGDACPTGGQMRGHPLSEVCAVRLKSFFSHHLPGCGTLCTGMVPTVETQPPGAGPGRTAKSPQAGIGGTSLWLMWL